MPAQPILRVVIIDDHEMLLESLVRLIGSQGDLEVVGKASSCAEGLSQIEHHLPDAVVTDYRLPDGDGAQIARRVAETWPYGSIHRTQTDGAQAGTR